jgi:two-component system cell cycle response regulator
MVSVLDVSAQMEYVGTAVYVAGTIAIGAGLVLLGLLYWLVGRVSRQIRHNEMVLRSLETHDSLTGLYNRRSFYRMLNEEIVRSARYQKSVSLLRLVPDDFDKLDDEQAHTAGDEVLRTLAKRIKREARNVDRVCRLGGRELAIILPETEVGVAMLVAVRLRTAVADHPFPVGPGKQLDITVSIGVAAYPENGSVADDLVCAADHALSGAKDSGGNKVWRSASESTVEASQR